MTTPTTYSTDREAIEAVLATYEAVKTRDKVARISLELAKDIRDHLSRVATSKPADGPVPMVLHCPECRTRHVDVGEFATKAHHTHACQGCGLVWRPAIGPTVGVQFLPGFKDRPSPPAPDDAAERVAGGLYQWRLHDEGYDPSGPAQDERHDPACALSNDDAGQCCTCGLAERQKAEGPEQAVEVLRELAACLEAGTDAGRYRAALEAARAILASHPKGVTP